MSEFRRVLPQVIAFLEEKNIDYVLVRNFEGYPDILTGDIDIYAHLEKLRLSLAELEKLFSLNGWITVRKVRRPWVLVLQLINNDPLLDRNIVVIEIYDRCRWLSFDYVSFDRVMREKIRYRHMTVVNKPAGMFVTFFHYFFWAGFFPEKYQAKISSERNELTRLFDSVLLPPLLRKLIIRQLDRVCSLRAEEWKQEEYIPERIHRFDGFLLLLSKAGIIANSFIHAPLDTFNRVIVIGWLWLRDVVSIPGMVWIVRRGVVDAQELLVSVKQYHVYKNRFNIVIPLDAEGNSHWVRTLRVIFRCISRGGLCILEYEDGSRDSLRFIKRVFSGKLLDVSSFFIEKSSHSGTIARVLQSQQ